jgi:ketosteroid isomerase-like protein
MSNDHAVLLLILVFGSVFFYGSNVCSQTHLAATDTINRRDTVEEQIWALEKAYFTDLYKADYEGVLAIVDSQFLGWPGDLPQPVDKEESARFMKQLITKPTSCTLWIERFGIRVTGEMALTQYILHVTCSDTSGISKTQSSRITHTWVKKDSSWKLLGGMSSGK